MVEPLYRGRFNKSTPKPIANSKHRVVEYRAKEDFVTCTCGFEGTALGFETHNSGKKRDSSTYTTILRDIKNARGDYYLQGSSGFYVASEDKIFD